jgi:hypothetical protein
MRQDFRIFTGPEHFNTPNVVLRIIGKNVSSTIQLNPAGFTMHDAANTTEIETWLTMFDDKINKWGEGDLEYILATMLKYYLFFLILFYHPGSGQGTPNR